MGGRRMIARRCWLQELAGSLLVAAVAWIVSAPRQPTDK